MRPRIPIVAFAVLGALACGSGANGERAPEANVAESLPAERAFRVIARAWATARPDERGKLEPLLREFLRRHPDDRRARQVRVHLAWLLAQRGDLAGARQLVEQARRGPSGTARDFASVAQAAILLREGKPEQALSVLAPLEGKIIDPVERFMFGEQLVLAALGARRQAMAVGHMLDWLAQAAPEDRDTVQGRVHELVQGLAPEPLDRSLSRLVEQRKAESSSADTSAARDWLIDVLSDRLARIAVERQDGELARKLLDSGVESFRRGGRGAALARIATTGSVLPQISGRAVGLVISVLTNEQRERSAQVTAGVAAALGLPQSASNPSAVRLVTSEDDGSEGGMRKALVALAGEGAAILVAGVDEPGAKRAAEYADDADIPVLLLAPAKVASAGYGFALAPDPVAEGAALDAALEAQGATSLARVGRDGVPCDSAPKAAGAPRFPVEQWKRDKIDGVAVLGGAVCARDVSRELGGGVRRVWLGLGLEAAEVFGTLEVAQPRVALSAGPFPHRSDGPSPPSLTKYIKKTQRAPGWYTALGHDAAALASAALGAFPLEQVDDARTVAELHRRARDSLSGAEAELWTSDQRGFASQRLLPRNLAGVTLAAKAVKGQKP